MASEYAYAGGNSISNLDPLGLWKVSGSVYLGPGFSLSFRNSHCCRFLTARLGLGAGFGLNLDKGESPFPGMPSTPPGPHKFTIAATVQGGVRVFSGSGWSENRRAGQVPGAAKLRWESRETTELKSPYGSMRYPPRTCKDLGESNGSDRFLGFAQRGIPIY